MENNPNELELSFYKQFSENQNEHKNILTRLIGLLGAVVFGYGYILVGFSKDQFDNNDVFLALIITETLLLIGLNLVIDMGFSFRRDQLIVYRIRKKYELIAENENEDESKVFPYLFNPLKKFQIVDSKIKTNGFEPFLLPGFHNIFAGLFFLFQIICFYAYYLKINSDIGIIIFLFILSCFISIWIYRLKDIKLKKMFFNEFKRQKKLHPTKNKKH